MIENLQNQGIQPIGHLVMNNSSDIYKMWFWRLNMRIKRVSALVILAIIINSISIYGAFDTSILSDPVVNTYQGREIGEAIIENIQFDDVEASYWAKEVVTRLGAMEIVKGTSNGNYQPEESVSNEEVLTLLIRTIGMEEQAIIAAEAIAATYGNDENLTTIWSKGYLQIASQIGLITAADLASALAVDQTALDPTVNFIRTDAVTREQAAKWLVEALSYINPGSIDPIYTYQDLFNYSDWDDVTLDYAPYVEAVSRAEIMNGDGSSFNPQASLTRAEMAQVIKNIDDILYETMGYERKAGIVGAIADYDDLTMISDTSSKQILIRSDAGTVDQIIYEYSENIIGTTITKEVPVYQDGLVTGLNALTEGAYIEYIVNPATNEVLYVNSQSTSTETTISGVLQSLVDVANGEITIKTDSGSYHTYKMIDGIYNGINETILIGEDDYTKEEAPVGSRITLTLNNDLVTEITYTGYKLIYNEISGIVKVINTDFSYITIIDWDGNEITKYFIKDEVSVEKQNYYDEYDEIGYIDEMFPNYDFDEKDSSIYEIEAGDIVHMRLDTDNSQYVDMISAKTNYIVKYGTIQEVSYNGAEGASVIIEYDDGSVGTYTVDADVPVLKASKNVGVSALEAGDVVRMLVNQAVISSGTVTETIKELVIDQYGNTVASIYKGELEYFNDAQRTVTLLDVYTLGKIGWTDYTTAKLLDISGDNIAYYKDEERISADYAEKYLKQDDMCVYVATTDYYGEERVTKVTFRDGRDSVLAYSNVTYSNGIDEINILNEEEAISIDEGTIVIKNGKLVESGNILSPDYAQIVLNGDMQAAIVNIETEPNNDALSLFRGRIDSVEENESFSIESHAVLMDMEWVYSAVPITFVIDEGTTIIDEDGTVALEDFIDYSDISVIDAVYTIVSEGTKATYIVENEYCEEGVYGEIYEVTEDTSIMIKDVLVYSSDDSSWNELSLKNSYAQINLLTNSIIIKNNAVIDETDLEVGDEIRIMTTDDLITNLADSDNREVSGYIIFVE
jgi:hypothetical protein